MEPKGERKKSKEGRDYFGSMCNHHDALRNFRRVSSIFVSSTGAAGACLCEYVCGEKWFLSKKKNMGSRRFF